MGNLIAKGNALDVKKISSWSMVSVFAQWSVLYYIMINANVALKTVTVVIHIQLTIVTVMDVNLVLCGMIGSASAIRLSESTFLLKESVFLVQVLAKIVVGLITALFAKSAMIIFSLIMTRQLATAERILDESIRKLII